MTQTAKDRALERLRLLEPIEQEIEELRLFLELYDRYETGDSPIPMAFLKNAPLPEKSAVSAAASDAQPFATKEEIAATVRDILKGETEPMNINYLYKLVTSRGLRITGQNPKGNLSAKLAPLPDVIYLKGRGWILKENMRPPKAEAPNGHRPNGASESGNGSDRESLPSPNFNL